eukprot:scaffold1101_cov123-Cylindrotheca_fusiformis.AAC.2
MRFNRRYIRLQLKALVFIKPKFGFSRDCRLTVIAADQNLSKAHKATIKFHHNACIRRAKTDPVWYLKLGKDPSSMKKSGFLHYGSQLEDARSHRDQGFLDACPCTEVVKTVSPICLSRFHLCPCLLPNFEVSVGSVQGA